MGGRKKKKTKKTKSEKILSINFLTLRMGKRWPFFKKCVYGFYFEFVLLVEYCHLAKEYGLFSFFLFFSFHEEVAALGDAMLDSVTRFSQLPTVMILCFCTRSSQLVCALEQECLNTVPHNPGI